MPRSVLQLAFVDVSFRVLVGRVLCHRCTQEACATHGVAVAYHVVPEPATRHGNPGGKCRHFANPPRSFSAKFCAERCYHRGSIARYVARVVEGSGSTSIDHCFGLRRSTSSTAAKRGKGYFTVPIHEKSLTSEYPSSFCRCQAFLWKCHTLSLRVADQVTTFGSVSTTSI